MGRARLGICLDGLLHERRQLGCGNVRSLAQGLAQPMTRREEHTVSRGVLCNGSAGCSPWSSISTSGSGRLPVALGRSLCGQLAICTVTARPGFLTDGQGFHPHRGQAAVIRAVEGFCTRLTGGREVAKWGRCRGILDNDWKFIQPCPITLMAPATLVSEGRVGILADPYMYVQTTRLHRVTPDTADPRLPSCGHDFCGSCLLGQYEIDVLPGRDLPCPLYRVPIVACPIQHWWTAETCEWLRETKGEVPPEGLKVLQDAFSKWFPIFVE